MEFAETFTDCMNAYDYPSNCYLMLLMSLCTVERRSSSNTNFHIFILFFYYCILTYVHVDGCAWQLLKKYDDFFQLYWFVFAVAWCGFYSINFVIDIFTTVVHRLSQVGGGLYPREGPSDSLSKTTWVFVFVREIKVNGLIHHGGREFRTKFV